jgi:hypothetical protein
LLFRRPFVRRPRSLLCIVPGLLAVLVPLLAAAPPASADDSVCGSAPVSQPFSPWGDPSSYELAPSGDFETAGWSLLNGAALVNGSDPFAITGALGQSSLSLPQGASAISGPICVNVQYPTLRFMIDGTGVVAVSVAYGNTVIPAGSAAGAGSWAPGPIAVTGSGIPGAANGGSALVNIILTSTQGTAQIDDVYVDPYHGCC